MQKEPGRVSGKEAAGGKRIGEKQCGGQHADQMGRAHGATGQEATAIQMQIRKPTEAVFHVQDAVVSRCHQGK